MNDCIIKCEKLTISSTHLDDDRKYVVYLPYGYEQSEERYSILLVVNANYDAYFAHAASVVQLLSSSGRIPPMIVVGIHTDDHAIDFFPVPHPRIPNSGQADNFLRFVTDEFLPLINRTYRTNDFRILYGQSNGGMFTVYSLLKNPDSFNAYIAGSPMLGWCAEVFMDMGKELFSSGKTLNHFLYMEYGENDYEKVITTVPDFARLLGESRSENFVWAFRNIISESHAPITTLYNGLSLIFPEWQITTERGMIEGLEGVEQFYKGLSEKYGIDTRIPEEVLSDIGVSWILKENPENGRPFLEKMIDMYPFSEGGYYLLGVVEERAEQYDLAAVLYRKSLEINPEFPSAREKLKHLENEGKI